jgi:hypothetical protein
MKKFMGDANDLNLENVSPENSRVRIISDSKYGSCLPVEIFVGKLEKLLGEKVISYKRIVKIAQDSLAEIGKTSGDFILEYTPSMEQAIDISDRYFKSSYRETSRGYVRK